MLKSLNIKAVTQLDDFSALENEWKALSQNSNSGNVFLTWEWISTWWECFSTGRQLFILTARRINDGKLLGLAPLNVQRLIYKNIIHYRELSFMENQLAAPDHLDIISGAGSEEEKSFCELHFREQVHVGCDKIGQCSIGIFVLTPHA